MFRWKIEFEKLDKTLTAKIGELNPADTDMRECRPKVLPQLWFHDPKFLKLPNKKWHEFDVVPAMPPEIGKKELRTTMTVNTRSMTKSNEDWL